MSLLSGKLTSRVKIEQATTADDGGGGTIRSWTDLGRCKVHIERVKSVGKEVERLQAGGLLAQPLVRVHARKTDRLSKLTNGDRFEVIETGETLDIQSAQPAENSRRVLVFTCIVAVAT